MDDEISIEDLMAAAIAQTPGDFEMAFNTLITDKIAKAVDDKKIEVAQGMFSDEEEEDKEEETE
jgi:hypothetical protein